jgi:long-chain acyl-CoA synthetase
VAVVTFVIKFTVKGDPEEFEQVFAEHVGYLSAQPGFLGNELVRSFSNPQVYLNVARWESAPVYKAVVGGEEFQRQTKGLTDLVEVEADLYQAVPSGSRPSAA